MADCKVCDCCGEVITDLYEARMHVFYMADQDDGHGWSFKIKHKSPEIKVDLCGKCWDKLRGFAPEDE